MPFPDRITQAYAAANLFGMLVERGDLAEAPALGRTVLEELRALRIVVGWTDHFWSYQARTGNVPDAVRLVAWGDATRARKELNRQPNEVRARQYVLTQARSSMREADIERLVAEGAARTAMAVACGGNSAGCISRPRGAAPTPNRGEDRTVCSSAKETAERRPSGCQSGRLRATAARQPPTPRSPDADRLDYRAGNCGTAPP
ncbi:MAG: hypothetical protein IT516_08510 [Burkholderiales bacterium]|nr:hypothetical protein [Burkholderiales bacterium]